ncbi:MAG: hypothetical protein PHS93_08140 [Candidatus Omnitrophica bacterium]|nr:hypothetical protein [Candidatus Omnitrophota bacterium]
MKLTYDFITKNYKKLSSVKFEFDNFCLRAGYNHNNIFEKNGDFKNNRFSVLGYCDGCDLTVRPRFDSIGVMLFDNENNIAFWIHFYKG